MADEASLLRLVDVFMPALPALEEAGLCERVVVRRELPLGLTVRASTAKEPSSEDIGIDEDDDEDVVVDAFDGRRRTLIAAPLGEASERVRLRDAPLEGIAQGGRRGPATDAVDVVDMRLSVRLGSLTMRPSVGLGAMMGVVPSRTCSTSSAGGFVLECSDGVEETMC